MRFWSLVHYVLTAAVRDRVFAGFGAAVLLSCALAVFLGSAAVAEQGAFALVFAASGVRLVGVLGLVLFAVFYIRRAFEAKDVEFLLSRPISRLMFVCAHACAFAVLAVFVAVLQGVCVCVLSAGAVSMGFGVWVLSAGFEAVMMVCVALFFAMQISSSTAACLAAFGFYGLARMMGGILGALDAGVSLPGADVMAFVVQAISLVIPRLDLLAQSSWLLYGGVTFADVGLAFAQTVVFVGLVMAATILDLVRRQF